MATRKTNPKAPTVLPVTTMPELAESRLPERPSHVKDTDGSGCGGSASALLMPPAVGGAIPMSSPSFDINRYTLLSTEDLAARIGYQPRTIRNTWLGVRLFAGIHYFRLPKARKYVFLWENIVRDVLNGTPPEINIPMANGGVARG